MTFNASRKSSCWFWFMCWFRFDSSFSRDVFWHCGCFFSCHLTLIGRTSCLSPFWQHWFCRASGSSFHRVIPSVFRMLPCILFLSPLEDLACLKMEDDIRVHLRRWRTDLLPAFWRVFRISLIPTVDIECRKRKHWNIWKDPGYWSCRVMHVAITHLEEDSWPPHDLFWVSVVISRIDTECVTECLTWSDGCIHGWCDVHEPLVEVRLVPYLVLVGLQKVDNPMYNCTEPFCTNIVFFTEQLADELIDVLLDVGFGSRLCHIVCFAHPDCVVPHEILVSCSGIPLLPISGFIDVRSLVSHQKSEECW